jgi:hypothetical protein
LSHSAQPVAVIYASWRQNRLLTLAERYGTFASTFIEKLQQASSDDRILHRLCQHALHPANQQLTSKVTAEFRDGVLKVHLPTTPVAKSKATQVKVA